MRRNSIAIMGTVLLAAWAPRSFGQPVADAACGEIRRACERAGFKPGGFGGGTGLMTDCVAPIMQGTAQPRRARLPLPRVASQLVAACKATNPRFGERDAPPTQAPVPPSETLPTVPSPTVQRPASAGASATCASSEDLMPNGLVVVLPPEAKRAPREELQALDNPSISGAAAQIDWRDLEPIEGQPDWSKLDGLFAAAQSSNKWVQLLIFPGFFSPPWALEGAETELFPIQYGPGHGTVTKLPMPWDRVYLGRWFAFLKLLSARYGASPAFRMMAADGPTSVSAEMTLPLGPPGVEKWIGHGYTPRRYLDAWANVFRVYAETFPHQCISLSGPGLPILGNGKVRDPVAHARAREMIIEGASNVLGRRFAWQWSDLHAGRAAVEAPSQLDSMINHAGRVITGMQMRTSAEGDSAVMGAAGNPVAALKASVDLGMRRGPGGRHVNYLEVYEPDVLAAEMQPVLRSAASQLGSR
jgi:hypothetical protein